VPPLLRKGSKLKGFPLMGALQREGLNGNGEVSVEWKRSANSS
jgi:hypothetical protein